ncbi:MAG TPA: hypothetical protein VLB83_01855 [Candidatus Paceibacterota bacterium]|nr:hypothetical protein [Candidatus Paceibacterota bacterium]
MTGALIAFAIAAGLAHWAVLVLTPLRTAPAAARIIAIGPVIAALCGSASAATIGIHLLFFPDLTPLKHLFWTIPLCLAITFFVLMRVAAFAAEARQERAADAALNDKHDDTPEDDR